MSKMKILLIMVGILTPVFATPGPAKPQPQLRGNVVDGLQMSVSPDKNADRHDKATHFRIKFRNVGLQYLRFSVGGVGCVGERRSAIMLHLVDSQGVQHRHLPFLGDGPPYAGGSCAGISPAPDVVPLPPGGSFSVPLDLGKYLAFVDFEKYAMARFHAGTYSLQVELAGAPMALPGGQGSNWTGTVVSNILQVHFDAEFAAPLADYWPH